MIIWGLGFRSSEVKKVNPRDPIDPVAIRVRNDTLGWGLGFRSLEDYKKVNPRDPIDPVAIPRRNDNLGFRV
jgi:hypothetical protein